MHSTVVTKDPTAVAVEVQSAYLSVFPDGNPDFVPQAFTWATECFTGHFRDYQAVDAPYHDFEHTLQGTLCMARLLRGWHRAGAQPQLTQRMFELGLLAILLHDSGYLKKRGDTEGTGAKYTVTHVARSMEFAAELLGEKGFNTAEIQSVQRMIHCTGLDAALAVISFSSELERTVGYALGTADLLGQMAAGDYVEKLPVLYEEFAEAARHSKAKTHFISLYSSAEDLMRKTPAFWENFVQLKLKRDLGGVYRYLSDPFPDGPNVYLECIAANMARLRQCFQL
ncbi:MAG: hypothetical protein ACTHLW_17355 [Verrucomicrobiota bacterium]